MYTAAEQEASRLASGYPGIYTGLIACQRTNTLTVFRVPGNADFDSALRSVAAKWHVRVVPADTKFSRQTLTAAQDVVLKKSPELAAAGAAFRDMGPEPEGFLRVGVAAHPGRARRILSEIADRIKVVVDRRIAVPS